MSNIYYLNYLRHFFDDSLLRNSVHLILSSIATSGLGLISWMVIARFYPTTHVGLAASLISSMYLVSLISNLGLNISLIKFLPAYKKKNDIINSCLTAGMIAALVVSSAFVLGIEIWSPSLSFLKNYPFYGLLFVILTCIWAITALINSIFISNLCSEYVLIKEVIFGIFKIPVPIFFVPFGAMGVFIAWCLCAFISLFYGLKIMHKTLANYKFRLILNKNIIKNMLSFSIWNYISNFFNLMPGYVLPIMIANLTSPNEAAYFYTAWSFSNILFMIPKQATQSLFAEGSNTQDKLNIYSFKSIKFIFSILIPSAILILIFGDKFLLIFGSEYSIEGFKLLQIFAISSIPLAVCTIYITIKNVEAKVKTVSLINGIIAAITLASSYLFLDRMGLVGVGYAWALSNTFMALAIVLLSIRKHYLKK